MKSTLKGNKVFLIVQNCLTESFNFKYYTAKYLAINKQTVFKIKYGYDIKPVITKYRKNENVKSAYVCLKVQVS